VWAGDSATVAKSTHARVWQTLEPATVGGCLFRVGRSWPLGTGDCAPYECEWFWSVVFAGRLVGYSYNHVQGDDRCRYRVRVIDLKTGELRRSLVPGKLYSHTPAQPGGPPPCGVAALRVVLKLDGAVAWIGGDGSTDPVTYQVHRVDSRGRANLDTGPAIDPKSLRRHRSAITWTNGGVVRSARLK
jgi:hypothetical protein